MLPSLDRVENGIRLIDKTRPSAFGYNLDFESPAARVKARGGRNAPRGVGARPESGAFHGWRRRVRGLGVGNRRLRKYPDQDPAWRRRDRPERPPIAHRKVGVPHDLCRPAREQRPRRNYRDASRPGLIPPRWKGRRETDNAPGDA